MDLFTGGSVIVDYGLGSSYLNLKHFNNGLVIFLQTHRFSLHKTLTDGLEWCVLLVYYCDVFISCLNSF